MADLSTTQLDALGRFFFGNAVKQFYENPKNEEAYREWYLKRYGEYPKD